ncbi:porin [Variovorax rhizosphaerae]|uniref:Porin n=1 Tax=Variovorax rhizosphaerae TaxID=1836200 RepID=A0ABU8WUW0_9BURK
MKATLAALATLAVAGTASAQSSLTLFGVMDAGISYYETKSNRYTNNPLMAAPLFAPDNVTRSKWAMSTGGNSGSRLGFRGTEDLGGGLAASFWLEAALANDTGLGTAPGGIIGFNRRSTLSLSGGFGEIRLGRDFTPIYTNDLIADPWVNSGVGATLFGSLGANLATLRGPGSPVAASDHYTRASNSIGYFLPPGLGGFYGQLMYGLPETVKLSNAPQAPSSTGRYFGGRFGYARGPVDVAIAYGSSQAADGLVAAALVNNKIDIASVIATYDFGPLKLYGELMQTQDKRESTSISAITRIKDKYKGGLIGVTVPVGPGQFRATYAKVKFDTGAEVAPLSVGSTDMDASSQKLALGYVYNLSKRTAFYATVAKVQIKDGQNNPVVMGSTTGGGLTYLSTGAGVQGYAPRSSMGYDFGFRHAF